MNKFLHIIVISALVFSTSPGFGQEAKGIRHFIADTAANIGKFSSVDIDVVGPGGIITNQLERFFYLLQNATNEELVSLIRTNKPNVRAYAFWSLAIKKYNKIEDILEAQLADSTVISCRLNCADFPMQLYAFYLMVLSSSSHVMHGLTLSEEELSNYRSKMQN